MPGITISAGYGAGGSTVAPGVAERMGWRFLDRAISSMVAERLQVPVAEVEKGGSQPSRLDRFLASLAPLAPPPEDGPVVAGPSQEETEIRETAEELLRDAVRGGGAVVLGRAGACALLHEPQVLRVRLYGPREARIAFASRRENVSLETAGRRIDQVDQARDAFIWRLYGRRADDQELYHLQLDSTALPLSACIDLVVDAFRQLVAGAERSS